MNKSNLRTGDMVVMRNGKKATVMCGVGTGNSSIFRYHTDTNSFTYINKYSESLVHPTNNNYDVMSVYRLSDSIDRSVYGDAIFNPDKMLEYGTMIMSRVDENPTVDNSDRNDNIIRSGDFDINELKTGDLIVFANGKRGTIFKNIPNYPDIVRFHTTTNSFMPTTRWNGVNHESNSGYNIEKVYRAISGQENKIYNAIANPDLMENDDNLIYARLSNSTTNNVTNYESNEDLLAFFRGLISTMLP